MPINVITENCVRVRITTRALFTSETDEVFPKTVEFLWNPEEGIVSKSMELTPPSPIRLLMLDQTPAGTSLGMCSGEIISIASRYSAHEGTTLDIPFEVEVLPPDITELPLPKRKEEQYSKLADKYQIMITHPNLFSKRFTNKAQRVSLVCYLNEAFVPLEKIDLLPKHYGPLETHSNTNTALELVLNAARVIGISFTQIRIANFIFTVEETDRK